MHRRDFFQTTLAAGGLGLAGCATTGQPDGKAHAQGILPPLEPIRAHVDRITDIKVCLRPFRAAGPRLDVESMGDTLVVHNYGHGGSGWSLSWGSASIAVEKAMAGSPRNVAVIGCGIIGLTSAITAQRAGAQVTIYARDLLPRTRSVRANGSWTPDSRISLAEPAGPGFAALWERMARTSWKTYRTYLGMAGKPIEFCDSYALSEKPIREEDEKPDSSIKGDFASTGAPQQNAEFGRYSDRITDLTPKAEHFAGAETPFPVDYVARSPIMFFNFAEYGDVLMRQFYGAGGRVVIREFHTPAELTELPEKVVINCPGFAARDLWRDKTVIPVRGQTNWLIPQTEVNYGIYYKGIAVLPKSDGILVQDVHASEGDLSGFGNGMELEDRAEAENAVRTIEALYKNFPRGRIG